ncbi:MAG: clostripain-related cysteine peptidase [Proteobacteria bacterium]|nr:clostripain-related cysteine peptidase [Pseudomonadota bacterium]
MKLLIGTAVRFSWIFILVFLLSFLSCAGEKQADWTLLFYFDGDNSLAEDAFKDLQELERVGSNPQIRLVAQADFPQNYKPDLAATRRFEIIQDDDPETLTSPLLESLGEADMADPRTLTDFIIWGKKNFPALSYALILWDHGEAWYQESITSQTTEVQGSRFLPAPRLRQAGKAQGWKTPSHLATQPPVFSPQPEAIFLDEDNHSDLMKNFQLREALEAAGVHFDLLVFDACIMATVEVAYELKDQADIMVASQELVQNNGLPYDVIVAGINENPEKTAEELAAGIVDDYRDYCEEIYYPQGLRPDQTLSAIRLGIDLSTLASVVDQTALHFLNNLPAEAENIFSARNEVEEFEFAPFRAHFYVDLYDLFSRLNPPANLIAGFSEGFSRTIIREYHGPVHPQTHGLSIVFPKTPDANSNYDPTYSDYDPASGTGSPSLFMQLSWDNLLSEYYRLKYPGIIP